MQFEKFESVGQLVEKIVKNITEIVVKKPEAVLCFACGETPRPVMNRLIQMKKSGEINFSKIKILGLDEWIGVGRETTGSCAQMLYDDFLIPMDFRPDQIHIFNGLAANLDLEVEQANQFIKDYGIDFVLLGIGMNGHIGLNEPGCDPMAKVNVISLSETTRKVMTKYFNDTIFLTQGITLGLSQLLKANHVVLMAVGERKAEIVKRVLNSDVTPDVPATVFKNKEKVCFFVDAEAGQFLK